MEEFTDALHLCRPSRKFVVREWLSIIFTLGLVTCRSKNFLKVAGNMEVRLVMKLYGVVSNDFWVDFALLLWTDNLMVWRYGIFSFQTAKVKFACTNSLYSCLQYGTPLSTILCVYWCLLSKLKPDSMQYSEKSNLVCTLFYSFAIVLALRFRVLITYATWYNLVAEQKYFDSLPA